MLFRKLKANEIDVRIGNAINSPKWQGYSLLLYKDARVDMDILDESGVIWQREHYELKGNIYCKVGIYNTEIGQWVWKSDCGVESNTQKEKGEASDSFKRACVNWGIGRELYTTPANLLIPCELDNGKIPRSEQYRKFEVVEIDYNDNGEICLLKIIDKKSKELVYNFCRK